MAPSSGRDDDPQDSSQSSDNPFIRFRQFADAKIGSFLQGVIGLPSAFSKVPGNTRWADFDDDLKRRDELQTRRKELRESEARRLNEPATGREESVPVNRSSDWNSSHTSGIGTSATRRQMNNGENYESSEDVSTAKGHLGLYSPVTKPLFAHLEQSPNDDVDWKQRESRVFGLFDDPQLKLPVGWEGRKNTWGRTYYVDHNTRTTTWNPATAFLYLLRHDQLSSEVPKMIQYMAYNNLNSTGTASGPFWGSLSLHSNASLLPYLLFSPYSPLKLSEAAQDPYEPQDAFPYREAFEDLMMLHHGLPMVSRPGGYRSPKSTLQQDQVSRAKEGMAWIYSLGARGVLSATSAQLPSQAATSVGGIMDEIHRSINKANPSATDSSSDAQTEQEMYERFLRSASSISATSVDVFDDIFTDAERFIKQQVGALEKQNEINDSAGPSRIDVDSKSVLPKQISDTERVVSTFTSSEHITHEDGTVETTLSVRKRFADGRETVTESSHIELPRSEDEGCESDDTKHEQPRVDEAPKAENGKKGWFWN